MFRVNEYFDGRVKSIAFENADGPATVGVMAPGEYEFGTSTIEYMTITSGALEVQLPGETMENYKPFETFVVRERKFRVKAVQDTHTGVCLSRCRVTAYVVSSTGCAGLGVRVQGTGFRVLG